MGVNLGEIYAVLSLKNSGWAKAAQTAGRQLQELSAKAKRFGKEVGQISTALAAVGGGAVALAAQYDRGVKQHFDRVRDAGIELAIQVARTLGPAMDALRDKIGYVAAVIREMDPATKAAIASFLGMATAIGVVVAAGSKIVSPMLSLLGAVAPLLPAILGIAAALGAVYAVSAVMRAAWQKDWGGMRTTTMSVLDGIAARWGQFVDYLKPAWQAFLAWWNSSFSSTADSILRTLGKLATEYVLKLYMVLSKLGNIPIPGLEDIKGKLLAVAATTAHIQQEGLAGAMRVAGFGAEAMGQTLAASWETWKEKAKAAGADVKDVMQRDLAAVKKWVASIPDDLKALAAKFGIKLDLDVKVPKFDKTLKEIDAALKSLMTKFASRLGVAGELIQTAGEGFKVGGVWGAVIAVFVDLLTRSATFKRIIDQVNQGLGMIADSLGGMFSSLVPVNDAINRLLKPVLDLLGRLLVGVSDSLYGFDIAINAFAEMFEGIGPEVKQAFDMIGKAIGFMLSPVKQIAAIMWVVVKTLQVVALTWNVMVRALQDVFRWLAKIDIFGAKPLAFLNSWADSLNGAIISTETLDITLAGLEKMMNASATATAAQAQAAKDAAAALSNVPSGYKVALARFNAATPEVPHLAGGGIVKKKTLAVVGESGPEAVVPLGRGMAAAGAGGVTITINVNGVTDPDSVAQRVKRVLERELFRLRGNPYASAPPMLTR